MFILTKNLANNNALSFQPLYFQATVYSQKGGGANNNKRFISSLYECGKHSSYKQNRKYWCVKAFLRGGVVETPTTLCDYHTSISNVLETLIFTLTANLEQCGGNNNIKSRCNNIIMLH